MAVDLHGRDSLLSYQSLADEDDEILHSHTSSSILKHNEKHEKMDEDDCIVELTSNMDSYCVFQREEKQLDGSSLSTDSDKSDEMSWPSWGFVDSPEYNLWSPLSSKHSSGVSSHTDNKDPFGYDSSLDQSCDELNMKFKKINMNEGWDSKINKIYGFHRLDSLTVVSSSNGLSLVDDQRHALQEELKIKTCWELKAQSLQHSETSKGNLQHYHTNKIVKAIGYGNNRQRVLPGGVSCSGVGTVAGRQQPHKYQRTSLDCNKVSFGGSNVRSGSCHCGTGVFLPRTNTTANSSESRKKAGCSTVLIPARVVQALQQHFDQIGLKTAKKTSLPPLHDVLVHNKDGMYSLQKHYLERVSSQSQKRTSLPQEWTY